jgi:hypothetical protein
MSVRQRWFYGANFRPKPGDPAYNQFLIPWENRSHFYVMMVRISSSWSAKTIPNPCSREKFDFQRICGLDSNLCPTCRLVCRFPDYQYPRSWGCVGHAEYPIKDVTASSIIRSTHNVVSKAYNGYCVLCLGF